MNAEVTMKNQVENLTSNAKVWEMMAQFGKPIDQISKTYLIEEGFADGRTRAVGCMGWIWCQWLLGTPTVMIRRCVEPFIERGMEMQNLSTKYHLRPLHDLYLLHCAIFASNDSQLNYLAQRVVDASGNGKYQPRNDGELYASAWAGMIKYQILGDRQKSAEQFEITCDANHDIAFKAASKQLVAPWIEGNWQSFLKNQQKDFEKRWVRARKDGTVMSESGSERVINMDKLSSVQQLWCWAHCGMALLAHRQGIEVATDPFWFPSYALKCVDTGK